MTTTEPSATLPVDNATSTTFPSTTFTTTENPYAFIDPINKVEIIVAFTVVGLVTIGCCALAISHFVKQCRRNKTSYDVFYDDNYYQSHE